MTLYEGQERVESYRWLLSRNVVADLKLTGPKVTSNDLEMLRRYLDLAKKAWGDDDVSAQATQVQIRARP